eukprot:1160760-Pelagomonas_calceolata.AAC.11
MQAELACKGHDGNGKLAHGRCIDLKHSMEAGRLAWWQSANGAEPLCVPPTQQSCCLTWICTNWVTDLPMQVDARLRDQALEIHAQERVGSVFSSSKQPHLYFQADISSEHQALLTHVREGVRIRQLWDQIRDLARQLPQPLCSFPGSACMEVKRQKCVHARLAERGRGMRGYEESFDVLCAMRTEGIVKGMRDAG